MIETERLRLRNWREGDDERLHIHCNTPAVMRWLGGVQPRDKMTEMLDAGLYSPNRSGLVSA